MVQNCMMENGGGKVKIAIDFDGTITNEVGDPYDETTWVHLKEKTINRKVVDFMWDLVTKDWEIIIHTARDWKEYKELKQFLEDYEIPYDYIVCGKPTADVYLDDRNMKLEDLK